jgi:hypothetical protein
VNAVPRPTSIKSADDGSGIDSLVILYRRGIYVLSTASSSASLSMLRLKKATKGSAGIG